MSSRNLGKTDQPDGVREMGRESCPPGGHDSRRWVKVLGETRLLPVSGRPAQRVAAIGRIQRGRVARQQLLAAGIPSSVIGRMITHGLLRPEHAGVYAVLDATAVPLARETAALLACGDRAIVSHMSAAAVWGLVAASEGPVEVTLVNKRTGRRRPRIILHQSDSLLPRDVCVHDGLPVTSPARTLSDIAARLDTHSLERALDEALVVRKIVRREQLHDVCERAGRRPGIGRLKALLERRSRSQITHSEAERRCLELIREAGLPEPLTQVRIGDFVVDFLWPEHHVVFEIDGFAFHASRFAFDRDRRKDPAIKDAGYDPNRLTRDQVIFEPYRAVASLAAALARAVVRRELMSSR